MNTRRSSRIQKSLNKSPQRSPSPIEELIQRKYRGKRPKAGQRTVKAGDSAADREESSTRDVIDIINDTHTECVAEEDEGMVLSVVDKGVDNSDEDCVSVSSSYHNTTKKLRLSQNLCSACQKLYQKAKRMKAPMKNKLLDNDPKSLTCDQWVLIKKWSPRRQLHARGNLLILMQLVKSRRKLEKGVKHREGQSTVCSRPHYFLQRNLRRVRMALKRERKTNKRRKRKRDDSQGSRVAKQQRLHSNRHRQHTCNSGQDTSGLNPAGGHDSSPNFEDGSDQEVNIQENTHSDFKLIPRTVIQEAINITELPPREKTPKKTSGFRDLLAQLRGNSSMIVRETL